MGVLVTNTRLDGRGGTESFMRDLARGLQSRGRTLMAYGSDTQQQERLLDNDVIAVATDLEHLPVRPDVIHAMHHLDAMTAIASLPGVPALYHCHGAVWRRASPTPAHLSPSGRVHDLAERIAVEFNLAPDTITVLANSVDVARFRRVRSLPAGRRRVVLQQPPSPGQRHPRRDSGGGCAPARWISTAWARCSGGPRASRKTCRPEHVSSLHQGGRPSGPSPAAAPSSCSDARVAASSSGWRTSPRCAIAFSIAVSSPPPSPDRIVAALERFSAEECGVVSARLRQEAGFGRTVDALLVIYERS